VRSELGKRLRAGRGLPGDNKKESKKSANFPKGANKKTVSPSGLLQGGKPGGGIRPETYRKRNQRSRK